MKTIEKVYQASFIRGEQRRNYNDLVLLPHSSPPACCQRANFLSQLQFIDGYQVLGYLVSLRNFISLEQNVDLWLNWITYYLSIQSTSQKCKAVCTYVCVCVCFNGNCLQRYSTQGQLQTK